MSKLYALLDKATLQRYGWDIPRFFKRITDLDEPPTLLQYRNKTGDDDEVIADLQTIRRYYQGTLILNDRLALVAHADGIHLGQEDLCDVDSDIVRAAATVRAHIGERIFGLSTHNRVEIEEANRLPLDYIGLGAYRSTGTKKEATVAGEKLLALARLSKHPVALIGGVRLEDRFDESIAYKVVGSGLLSQDNR